MEPRFASLVSIVILLASRMAGMAADDTLAVGQMMVQGGADWVNWIEKAGTIGVCVWMLVWFQRRSDTQHAELARITERAVAALEHNAESDRELAQAVNGLKEVVEYCRR